MKKLIFFVLMMAIVFSALFAQWSNDPAQNNAICDLAGEQAIPKVVNGPTGNTYIGFFSNDSGNYDVRLQRLDFSGNELWDHNGILISDNPAMSWLTDWDMTVDADNHAILIFQDIRNGGNNNIYAYRIAPDGTFVWGANGLELSNSTAFDVSPKVCITSTGNTVVTWQADTVIIMQKIASDGTLLWGPNGITMSCADTYSWPQPFAIDNDEILLKFFEDTGTFPMTIRHCYMQKYDTNGNVVWANDTVISNVGGITAWTQVFNIISDENNGCFISWHDSRGGGTISYPFVQHVNSDGSVALTANGVQLSTEANRQNFYPESVYNAANNELITYWSQTDGAQNNHGITGQKLDASGNLLWGANGNNIISISSLYVLPFAVRAAGGYLMILFEEYTDAVNAYVKVMKLDTDGNYVWPDEQVTMCSVASGKVHSEASQFANNQIIAAWEDDRNGPKDIYAQNINLDGTIGGSLLVFLTSFEVEYIDNDVIVTWSTACEFGVLGWNILRSETVAFEDAIQINTDLIPGTGTPTTPADYTYIDDNILLGNTYYYWLECVFENGNNTFWGPISVTIPPPVFNPPQNLTVDPVTGIVTWDPPEPYPGVELLGYNLYLDGTFVGFLEQQTYQLENLIFGQTYTIGISAVYDLGESEIVTLEFIYVGTEAGNNIATVTELKGNYPNPFNPATTISFSVAQTSPFVTLAIFNIKGQKVKTLVDEILPAGNHTIVWNGEDENGKSVSSGVYFYKMKAGQYTATKKIILMK